MANSSSSHSFQSYLLSAIPFRRKSSTASSTLTTSTSSSSPIAEPSSFLSGHRSTISCCRCHANLALTDQIISKGFTGRYGRAYLVSPNPSATTFTTLGPVDPSGAPNELANISLHRPIPRHLVTGLHTVCDISCSACGLVLGWKYLAAEDEAQRYKVGKMILESRRTVIDSAWEGADMIQRPAQEDCEQGFGDHLGLACEHDGSAFDSQDEDECEDLFSGIWSPELAQRRRRRREFRD